MSTFQSKNVGGSLIVYEGQEIPNTALPCKFGLIPLPGLLNLRFVRMFEGLKMEKSSTPTYEI